MLCSEGACLIEEGFLPALWASKEIPCQQIYFGVEGQKRPRLTVVAVPKASSVGDVWRGAVQNYTELPLKRASGKPSQEGKSVSQAILRKGGERRDVNWGYCWKGGKEQLEKVGGMEHGRLRAEH